MITQSYTNNHIDVIYKLKILFYNFLYTNEVLSSFMQTLQTMLDAFNVSYMTATNSISIKLKKSCMRKLPNYSHTPQFYYQYFMPVFRDMYLGAMETIKELYSTTFGEVLDNIEYYLTYNIPSFINIVTLGDNIVIINL